MIKRPKCSKCGKIFQTTKDRVKCTVCRRLDNELSTRTKLRIVDKVQAVPIEVWEQDIKLLLVKAKWKMLSHIDIFRVCHIFVDITNDDLRFSGKDPHMQAILMLNELKIILEGNVKPRGVRYKSGRKVVLVKDGTLKKEYNSVKQASVELDLSQKFIRAVCEGKFGTKNTIYDLRWSANFNI